MEVCVGVRKEKTAPTACECLSTLEGVAYPAPPFPSSHLRSVSTGNDFWEDTMYYICPFTGVVWRTRYNEDTRNCPTVYIRTPCRQLPLDTYTIAKGVVQLYSEPLYPPREGPLLDYQLPQDVSLPSFPELPLQGLFCESLRPRSEVMWACENIQVQGRLFIDIWLRLLVPLSPGETGACWLASPLELISQQVLRSGAVLEWWFAGGQISEVRVEAQEEVPASEFFEWFGFDKPYRDTGKEFSAWLQSVRRRTRRR